jgi:hypothetical protein
MATLGTVIFGVVLLHLLVGFGFVLYKLMPPSESDKNTADSEIK